MFIPMLVRGRLGMRIEVVALRGETDGCYDFDAIMACYGAREGS
jgi:hypothetical protein